MKLIIKALIYLFQIVQASKDPLSTTYSEMEDFIRELEALDDSV